jgi:hypothetical protein
VDSQISETSVAGQNSHLPQTADVQGVQSINVAELIHIFKGYTSRVLRKGFQEMEEFFGARAFWANWYFADKV